MPDQALNSPRKSLTKRQLQEPIALDLLALLQTITSDGRLLESEVQMLKQWLDENQGSTPPAVEHLRGSVEVVLADGRVTPEEYAWLQKAVETVLPKEQRDLAALRRREAIADDRRLAEVEKQQLAEFRRLSRPMATFDVMVAGVLYDGRAKTVNHFVSEGDVVYLAREPQNQYSPNAISVLLANGLDIGYVPETEAVRLAPTLDGGALHSASVKKVLQGRRAPIPVIWGELYSAQAQVSDAVSQAQVPPKVTASSLPVAAPSVPSTIIPIQSVSQAQVPPTVTAPDPSLAAPSVPPNTIPIQPVSQAQVLPEVTGPDPPLAAPNVQPSIIPIQPASKRPSRNHVVLFVALALLFLLVWLVSHL